MLLFISDYPSLVTISIRVNQRRTHCPQSCLLIFCSVRMSTIIRKCCHIIWQKCCAPDCDQMWRSVSSLRVIPRSCDPDTRQYCHSTILLTSPQPGKMAAVRVMCSAWKSSIRRFVISEKAPTRAFSWLKAATTAFTFKTLLRHYA